MTPKNLVLMLFGGSALMLSIACKDGGNGGPTTVTPTLSSISVSGSSAVSVSEQAQLTATGTYSDGSTKEMTAEASFTSSSNGVATVNASGLLTGVSEGTATITAASQGRSGTLNVTVTRALAVFDLQVFFSRIDIDADCDAGANPGEFTYQVAVRYPGDDNFTVVNETNNYPGNNSDALPRNDGEQISLNVTARETKPADEDDLLQVRVRASEFDPSPDSRMNDRSGTRTHRFSGGQWSATGSNTIRLGGGTCQIELNYSFTPTLQ